MSTMIQKLYKNKVNLKKFHINRMAWKNFNQTLACNYNRIISYSSTLGWVKHFYIRQNTLLIQQDFEISKLY